LIGIFLSRWRERIEVRVDFLFMPTLIPAFSRQREKG